MGNSEHCGRTGCPRPVITSFFQEVFCLDHFYSRCYELLERIAAQPELNGSAPSQAADQLPMANECARRALEVSLRAEELNNLDRARLLDILLWSGDIVSSRTSNKPLRTRVGIKAGYERPGSRRQRADHVLP
jgi:hypothetical protein